MLAVISKILSDATEYGWVMEPETLRILELGKVAVVPHRWVWSAEEATNYAATIGYPVVAKVVSPAIMHKSEYGGVEVGVAEAGALTACFARFNAMPGFAGMLVAKMVHGLELIVGAKNDPQFGPVILLGMGGVKAEIYRDVTIRMAPLQADEVAAMVGKLQARQLLAGYRGQPPVDLAALTRLVVSFSELVMQLGAFASVDLNPVFCSASGCLVADGRIVLPRPE